MTVTLVYDELYLWHDTSASAGPVAGRQPWIEPGAPGEGPESRRRFKSLIHTSGLAEQLRIVAPTRPADDALAAVHTVAYRKLVEDVSASGGGLVGPNTPIGARGHEIACRAAAGTAAAVDAVFGGYSKRAYALVRPAGHHAGADQGRGNCVFNNVAAGARHAQSRWAAGRVAILDWDVHHGNGTESIFLDDADMLTISLHQDDWYPRGSGQAHVRGPAGTNINIPLPAGSGTAAYLTALDQIALPTIAAHRPDLIIVACGYDANAMDPYGRMLLNSRSFAQMTSLVADLADRICGGRLVFSHEGGYAPLYVPFCGLAVLETLSGNRTAVVDPFLERYSGEFQDLQPWQADVISGICDGIAETSGQAQ
jgi:acetoin utilization deacetylase AcuC-like enzyme